MEVGLELDVEALLPSPNTKFTTNSTNRSPKTIKINQDYLLVRFEIFSGLLKPKCLVDFEFRTS